MAGAHDIAWPTLEAAAIEAGFDTFGVTSADPFHTLIPFLEAYYQEGRESGFEHPLSALRWNPRALFPEAQSIVAVALPYETEAGRRLRHPSFRHGIVSRYAWGSDYHKVMRDKLQDLASRLSARSGRELHTLACVDTSSLVDRAVALRAGIGWIGKNAMLITKKYGSYVFLGALLLDASIEPEPVNHTEFDDCGACTLCLQACPTGALVDEGVLDGKKCLSGITQYKGVIPEEYRRPLGRRVWGCDTCQTVCPKNRLTLVSLAKEFVPDPELSFPDLTALLHMSARQFRAAYGHTAAAWRGHQVLRRNAIIALANARDLSALPDLIELLADPRPEIRGSAAWALRCLDPLKSREEVRRAWQCEDDESVKLEMIWAVTD